MQTNIQIGDLIADRYRVCHVLGGGGKSGMGIVYVCFDEEHGVINAVKTFQDSFIISYNAKERFKQEALAWIQLKGHPNIVHAYAVYDWNGRLYIILEYIAPDSFGRNTLTHYFNSPIDIKKVLEWSRQFCFAMEYAYDRGVTPHRDIKPDNLMITSEGALKVTDFGLAKQSVYGKNYSLIHKFGFFNKTNKTQMIGSPPWMAPEQFDGQADMRSDIYSFGVVLYQMRSGGSLPICPDKIEDFYRAHKNDQIPTLNSRLFSIIKRCLEKDPGSRYQSFAELRSDIDRQYRSILKVNPPEFEHEETQKHLEHFNKGLSLRNLGFLDDAIVEYQKALQYNNDFVNGHINLGYTFQQKGIFDKAIEHYNYALKKEPNNYKALVNLGSVFIEEGKLDEATYYLERGLEIEPNDYIARRNLSKVLFGKGLKDRAFVEARRTLLLKPSDLELRKVLADSLYEEGRINEAIMEFKEILKVNELDFDTHMKTGVAFSALNLFNEAQRELEIAVALDPKSEDARCVLGEILRDAGLLDKAIEQWEKVIKKDPTYLAAYNNLGVAFLHLERYEEAVKFIKAGLGINDKDGYLHYNLGCTYLNMKQFDKAIQEFRETISLNTDIVDVHYYLGCALQETGQKDAAISEFVKFVSSKNIDDPQMCVTMGQFFLENGLLEQSLAIYIRLSEMLPLQDREAVNKTIQMIKHCMYQQKL